MLAHVGLCVYESLPLHFFKLSLCLKPRADLLEINNWRISNLNNYFLIIW